MKLNRRRFLTGCAAGLVGSLGMASARNIPWRPLPRTKDGVETLGTARNLIFVLLDGAPSHVDTFDLKVGTWQPDYIGPESIGLGFDWPAGLMPKLAQRKDMFSLVRSLTAVEAVHTRAVYHLLTAHRQNAAAASEIPHIASVISYKLAAQRGPGDTLPTAMMIGQNPARNGFLPIEHLGVTLDRSGSIPNLEHPAPEGEAARFQLLETLQGLDPRAGAQTNQGAFHQQARRMMTDQELKSLLPEPNENDFSTSGAFVQQCETALGFIAANKGTRVFQLALGNWDHHVNIYQQGQGGLRDLGRAFDDGMSYLLDQLASLPAVDGPGTLLDETMVIAMGEFGRTVGQLNSSDGRDHFPNVVPAFIAGGGITPGLTIGRTNHDGGSIVDPGWSQNRFMGVNDLIATIYSAMGIDWTERVEDTPSGRVFELLDTSIDGDLYPIDSLFV